MQRILNKKRNLLFLEKETFEWIIISLFLVFSFFNRITLILFMISLLILLIQKEVGAIKILNIITIRSVISPGLAIDIGEVQGLKWIIINICSVYLMLAYFKLNSKIRYKLNKVIASILLFVIYSIISSYVFSTLPLIAISKVFSFAITFLGIVLGLAYTYKKFNWVNWMYSMFVIIFISSVPLLLSPIGFLRNGRAFQGIINHPNIYGVIVCLFVGIILVKLQNTQHYNSILAFFFLVSILYFITLSESRTAFISYFTLIIMYLILSKVDIKKKIILYSIFSIISIVIIFSSSILIDYFSDILFKNGNENILLSRSEQISGHFSNFMRNPWFGNGFAVPVTPFRSLTFSSEYIVEPGNLILAVLSYGGVFGFTLFINYILNIIYINKENFKKLIFLPIAGVMISMGEMVFFSTNNIGIWIYMYLSIYMLYSND